MEEESTKSLDEANINGNNNSKEEGIEDIDSAKVEIRKLRKKLRGIERLLKIKNRTLNEEENKKIAKREEYESKVNELVALIGEDDSENESSPPKIAKTSHHHCPWLRFNYDIASFTGQCDDVRALTSIDNSNNITNNQIEFVSSSGDTTSRLWHFLPKVDEQEISADSTQRQIFSGHSMAVTCAFIADSQKWFSSDFLATLQQEAGTNTDNPKNFLVTASLDCNIFIWDLNSGQILKELYTFQPITQFAFVDVDMVLTGCENGKLELWNIKDKQLLHGVQLDSNAKPVGWIERANDSGHIVTCTFVLF